MRCVILFLFFFFQAEDGIRDGRVTGVQTCALPILPNDGWIRGRLEFRKGRLLVSNIRRTIQISRGCVPTARHATDNGHDERSEERRVGKECRSRWWRKQ